MLNIFKNSLHQKIPKNPQNPYYHRLAQFDEFVFLDGHSELYSGRWNHSIFQREGPLCLEVGIGDGHFMLDYIEKNPECNFVGMDIRLKCGFRLAKKLSLLPFVNARYIRGRAERLEWIFAENELNRLFCFFPDPWPKRRHFKNRLLDISFFEKAFRVLRPGGQFFIKTDHQGYAEWILERIESQNFFFVNLKTFDLRREYPEHYLASFQTKFETLFMQKKIPIKAFELVSEKSSGLFAEKKEKGPL